MVKTLRVIAKELQRRGGSDLASDVLTVASSVRDLRRKRRYGLENEIERTKKNIDNARTREQSKKLRKRLAYLREELKDIGPRIEEPNKISRDFAGISKPYIITKP